LFAIRNFFIDKNNKIDRISLEKALSKLDLQFRPTGQDRASQLYMNNEMVENEIRSLEVSEKVSFIASLPIVRGYVDTILAKLGEKRGVVMDGRDIGTVVFPDAELKIFMTADAEVRATRRYNEMKAKGENPQFEDVLRNVKERDFLDENRDAAPLKRAPDAILLDNSKMTIDDQIVWFDNIISKRWN
jgi:CMP/dCMP kinase